MIIIKIPAKINLYGEYLVTQGYQGSAISIDKYIVAQVETSNQEIIIYNNKSIALLYDQNIFLNKCKINIIQNDIPIGKGLGSSSAYFLLVATSHLYLDNKFNKFAAFNLALELERKLNPSFSGIDTASCLIGGQIFYENEIITKFENNLIKTISLIDSQKNHNFTNCNENINKLILNKDNLNKLLKQSEICYHKIINNQKDFFNECLHYYQNLKSIIPIETLEMSKLTKKYNVKSTGYGCGGMMFSLNNFDHKQDNNFKNVNIDNNGLTIFDYRYSNFHDNLLNTINFETPNIGDVGIASAPSNIAFLKYWGKENDALQIPTNPSLSMTLPGFRTFTKIKCCAGFKKPITKLDKFLAKLINSKDRHLKIETYNNFPSDTGIASSASGYAAIVLAYSNMLKDFNMNKIFHWARIGSGSACRSVLENQDNLIKKETLIAWNYNQIYKINTNLILNHILIVFNPFPKEISSTDGHLLAKNSPLFKIRKNMAIQNYENLIKAFQDNDFDTIRIITENDTLLTHAIMRETYLNFITPRIQEFVSKFIEFRNHNKLNALFTIDAGENVHLIYLHNDKNKIQSFINGTFWISTIESNSLNYNFTLNKNDANLYNKITFYRKCILISGKRLSGKTFLANRLNEDLGFEVFNISDSIKKMYCDYHKINLDKILKNRSFKESHRINMIKFAENKLKTDKYFWCKILYNNLNQNCRYFIISDVRRFNDLIFFESTNSVLKIRINCDIKIREQRGFIQNDCDKMNSEIGLDDYNKWDINCIFNDENDYHNLLTKIKFKISK